MYTNLLRTSVLILGFFASSALYIEHTQAKPTGECACLCSLPHTPGTLITKEMTFHRQGCCVKDCRENKVVSVESDHCATYCKQNGKCPQGMSINPGNSSCEKPEGTCGSRLPWCE